jgi:Tfp pilus assembly protein PilE
MVVVAILCVLIVLAIGAYRRYMDNTRKSEVLSMFAEIRAKEEAYRAEFSSYLPMGTGGSTAVPGSDTAFYPTLTSNEPQPKCVVTAGSCAATPPATWNFLGIAPPKIQLYCGYAVSAGPSTMAPAGTYGAGVYPTAPTTNWWYAVATCDNDGDPSVNAIFVTTSDKDVVFEQNIHK